MTPVTWKDWCLVGLGYALFVAALPTIRRAWKGDSKTLSALRRNIPQTRLIAPEWIEHFIRSAIVGGVGAGLLVNGLILLFVAQILRDESAILSRIAAWAAVVLVVGLLTTFFLGISVFLFNRPRFATPPWARKEPGLLTRKLKHSVPANQGGDGS